MPMDSVSSAKAAFELKEQTAGRVCRCCGQSKPLSEFPKDQGKRLGHDTKCKVCKAPERLARYRNNLDEERRKSREYQRNLRAERPEEYAARQEKNRELRIALKRKYRRQDGARPLAELQAEAAARAAAAESKKIARAEQMAALCDAHVRLYKARQWHDWTPEEKQAFTAKQRERRAIQRKQISEQYVLRLLVKNTRMKRADIPLALVQVKQAQLRILKFINQTEREDL